VLEAKSIPGGRASSYQAQDAEELVDNCQHVLLGCCVNLIDFYQRAGVGDAIRWHREIHFLEPNGRWSTLRGARLPAPFHLLPSFFRLGFLSLGDKWAIAAALLTMMRSPGPRVDLPMRDWLDARRMPERAVRRFWRPILVSAINEDLERCSTRYAFQFFRMGFLGHPRAYEMGIPTVPLRDLYGPCVARLREAGCPVEFRRRVVGLQLNAEGRVSGALTEEDAPLPADYVVSALPPRELLALLPTGAARKPFFARFEKFETSPISAAHFWFDREVTRREHGVLLDRPVHWFFNKTRNYERESEATYLGLVVSASREWLTLSRREILAEAEREIRAALPGTRGAKITHAAVIKEARATFSATPGVDDLRPPPETPLAGLYLAGDWIRTGWPATMESAVRGGRLAAEAILAAEGRPERLLVPELPASPLIRGNREAG